MEMRVNGIGRLVVDGCDQLGGTGSQGIGLVVENAMDDAAVGDLLGIGTDRVGIERERPPTGFARAAQNVCNALIDRNRWLILLMVLDNRRA